MDVNDGPSGGQLPEKGLGGPTGFFSRRKRRPREFLSLWQASAPPGTALPGGCRDF